MELIFLGIFSLFFCVAAWWTSRAFRAPGCFWLNPLVLPLLVWAASYLLWAWVRTTVSPSDALLEREGAEPETRLLVVSFATLFIALLGVSLRTFVPSKARLIRPISVKNIAKQERFLIHLVFIATAGAWLTRFQWGLVFGLYEDFEALTHSFWENVIGSVSGLIWFSMPACLLAYSVSKQRLFLLESSLLLGLILAYALMSTSKGALMQPIFCLLIVASALGHGNIRRDGWVFAAAVVAIFVFGAYSYEIRDHAYFAIRGLGDYDVDAVAAHVFSLPLSDVLEKNLPNVLERVVGYGDALARMIEGSVDRRNPMYALGSLVEFGNIVPRFVWEDRPHLSFNHYVTEAVWGMHGLLSETPIGRIGEAFYVGGWFGFIYAIIYGALFGLFGVAWARLRGSVWGAAFAASLLIVWVMPDAYLTYGWKQVAGDFAIWFLGRTIMGFAVDSEVPQKGSHSGRTAYVSGGG
jgi:membrane protein implicated in regulation of membrane protease activity